MLRFLLTLASSSSLPLLYHNEPQRAPTQDRQATAISTNEIHSRNDIHMESSQIFEEKTLILKQLTQHLCDGETKILQLSLTKAHDDIRAKFDLRKAEHDEKILNLKAVSQL
jgi:hypothetical protein